MKRIAFLILTIVIVSCSEDNMNSNADSPIYLDENNFTVKASEGAIVGDTGIINGVTYTVVDEIVLRILVDNGRNVENLVTTKVTDMSYLFSGASTFNQRIRKWDVSNVTDMSYMFYGASEFNDQIEPWDVGNVTDMSYMFAEAKAFNRFISEWDVSNVTDMSHMFYGANTYDKPFNRWDVSNVADMSYMFSWTSFNQNIGSWETVNVTNCANFSANNFIWTLSKPNFTNCIP